jgi:NTP pyrophosphatase (non-canonical NTP hydrolase)
MKEIQNKVKEFCERYELECPLEVRVLDLVSELGEFAKEIIKSTNYGKKQFEFREEIKTELGDLFFSLIVLANQLGIDLEEALSLVLEKYEKRIKEKGSPGPEGGQTP